MGEFEQDHRSNTRKPAVEPDATEVKPKPRPTKNAFGLDATQMCSLLLRELSRRVDDAGIDDGSSMLSVVVTTTNDFTMIVREVAELSKSSTVRWEALADELSSVFVTSKKLSDLLAKEYPAARVHVAAALDELRDIVPSKNWLRANNGRNPSFEAATTDDRMHVARNALAAVRTTIGGLRSARVSVEGRAPELCGPLALHLRIAQDALVAIKDRRTRAVLVPDVQRLSRDMGELANLLSMEPKMTWDPAFAAAFDAENSLRVEALGLPAISRPYSGKLDPVEAVAQVRGAANGSPADGSTPHFDTPQSAVVAIGSAIGHVFQQQQHAAAAFKADIQEPALKTSSIWETLLDVAVGVAIASVAGAIGTLASNAIKKASDRFVLNRRVPGWESAVKMMTESEAATMKNHVLQDGALARTAAVDAVKDGTKELFKSSAKLALAKFSAKHLNAGTPINAFTQLQARVLSEASSSAMDVYASLVPSLVQADLEILNALHHSLRHEIAEAAYSRFYDRSMREWQNFKAQNESGPRDGAARQGSSTHSSTAGASHIREERDPDGSRSQLYGMYKSPKTAYQSSAGVFDVVVDFDTDRRAATVRELRLAGGEPAALRYFRLQSLPLAHLQMNCRYTVRLQAPLSSEDVIIGVGPDGELDRESLSQNELRLLKIIAERHPFDSRTVLQARKGAYDHVSDAAALRVARGIVAQLATVTTANLQG